MEHTLRPWVTAGIAIVGASVIAANPVAAPLSEAQQRPIHLSAIEHGVTPFPEVDWNDLVANTTANWNGLTEMFNNTTAIWSLPSAVYSQGLPQVFTDLQTEMQMLAVYNAAVAAQHGALDPNTPLPPLPNLYADPVLNPVSAVSLLLQNALGAGFGQNAAQVAWEGIYQNMLPSINDINTQFNSIFTQFGNLFTGGTFSMSTIQTDFATIGTDLTSIGNYLSLAPTTLLNGFLNGYPVQSTSPDPLDGTVPNIPDGYTLNAPYNANTNVATTPEFGLLTNPYAAITVNTSGFGDGAGTTFDGTVPLQTGTLAGLLQTEQTLSDELLTETAKIPGSGVTAPAGTSGLTVLGPDTLSFNLNLATIPVIGDVISFINGTAIPALNGALTTVITTTNTLISTVNSDVISLINDTLTPLSNTLTDTVNPFISAIDGIIDAINLIPGVDISAIDTVSFTIPSIPNIPTIPLSDIPTIPTIPTDVGDTFNLPGITEAGVPAYTWDITQNEMAILSSLAGLAAPVTGTVDSDSLGNFLADNPVMNLGAIFDGITASIFSGTPLTFTADLPLDWTNLLAESLNGIFTAV